MNASVVVTSPLGPSADSRSLSPKGGSLATTLHLLAASLQRLATSLLLLATSSHPLATSSHPLATSSHPLATSSWLLSPNAWAHFTSIDTGVPQSCCPDPMIARIRK
jgi:hypothetical protein